MPSATAPENTYDAIRPFVRMLEEEGMLDKVQFIGGISSAPLADRTTVILPGEKRIEAPVGFDLPSRRVDDGNTLRDMDVLVQSTDRREIARVEAMAKDALTVRARGRLRRDRKRLKPSVFGYHDAEEIEDGRIVTVLSDRYLDEEGVMFRALRGLFKVRMSAESSESWSMGIDGMDIPVPAPPVVILNYGNRSISGPRPKDEKIEKVARLLFRQVPDFVDWLRSGPGASELEFMKIVYSLREPAPVQAAEKLVIGGTIEIEPVPIRSLMDHSAFIPGHLDRRQKENVLALARIKSRGLHLAEANPTLRKLYQEYAEPFMDVVTMNR